MPELIHSNTAACRRSWGRRASGLAYWAGLRAARRGLLPHGAASEVLAGSAVAVDARVILWQPESLEIEFRSPNSTACHPPPDLDVSHATP